MIHAGRQPIRLSAGVFVGKEQMTAIHRMLGTLCLAFFAVASAHAQLTGELGAHDPSTLIYDNGRYYYYATGDLLSVRSSADLVNWTGESPAFDAVPSWISTAVPEYSGQSLWAPDIIELNNQYYLYYSASVWGTKLSAIGLATSPTLDPDDPNYGWTDQGIVIGSNHSTPYNAIDPSLLLDDTTGKLWMTWGSFNNGIYVTELNPTTGQPLDSSPGVNVAGPGPTVEIEGAAMIEHDGYYYMFVNWGGCCSGSDSTYNMRVGRSTSPTGPFLDANGVDMLDGGGTLFMDDDGRKIGPGHFSLTEVDGQLMFSYHYYDADRPWVSGMTGSPTYGLRNLYWTAAGWPSLAEVNPNWIGAARGNWETTGNWSNGVVPNGIGHIASFGTRASSRFSMSLPDDGVTLGTVNFRGTDAYTMGVAGGPTLTLDDIAGQTATLNVAEGSHTIAAPIVAVDHLEINVTPAASALTLADSVSATGMNKYGYGLLTLAGDNTYSSSVFVRNGTLEVTGTVNASSFNSVGQMLGETAALSVSQSGSFYSGGDLNIGDTGDASTPATGTLNLSDSASIEVGTGGGFYVGSGYFANTMAEGTVNQSGGTLTVNRTADGSFIIGGRYSSAANGTYNQSGGVVEANTNVFVGGRGEGSVVQTGGTFNAGEYVAIARYANSTGEWSVRNATLNQTNAGRWLIIGEEGEGTLSISYWGQVNAAGTVKLGLQASGSGTLELVGGTLSAPQLQRGAGTATVLFDSGVLQATANSTTFMQGLTTALVDTGGAYFDTQGYAITIAQPLLTNTAWPNLFDGGITKLGSGTLTLSGASTFTGFTNVDAGTLKLAGNAGIDDSNSIAVQSNATFDVASLNSVFTVQDRQWLSTRIDSLVVGDVIIGSGGVTSGFGRFTNDLTLEPDATITLNDEAATTTLYVDGDLLADSTAEISMEVAPLGVSDLLDIGGQLTLTDGFVLRVVFRGGLTANDLVAGDSWDLFDFATATGEFTLSDFILPTLTGNLVWDTSRLLVDGTLAVALPGLAGDFNGDGIVDMADYVVWRNHLGAAESVLPTGSTTDGSGIVDTGEYLTWKQNFGAQLPTSTSAASRVPEPSTAAALLLALASLLAGRRLVRG